MADEEDRVLARADEEVTLVDAGDVGDEDELAVLLEQVAPRGVSPLGAGRLLGSREANVE